MRLSRIFLIVAVLLVVVLGLVYVLGNMGGGGSDLTTEQVQETESAKITMSVVYLKQGVSRGEIIPIEKLGYKEVSLAEVTEDMFTDVVSVQSRIARQDIIPDEIITEDMLVGAPLGSEHSLLIPPGMVAVPVPVNRFSSVAYGISAGDRVNVIVTINFVDLDAEFQSILPNYTAGVITPGNNILLTDPGSIVYPLSFFNFTAQAGNAGTMTIAGRAEQDLVLDLPFYYVPSELQRPRVVSQTVLQNVMILHVGNFTLPGEEDTFSPDVIESPETPPTEATEIPAGPEPPDIVTLIVWPQDAVTLNYLIYTGAQITLALRNVGDSSQTLTDAVTLQYLMEVYRIPVPARLPYGTNPPIELLVPPILDNDKSDITVIE